MGDLTGASDTLPVRIGGVSSTTGLPDNYADVNIGGSLQVAGQGVAGTPAGGIVSIQGVASGTNLPVIISDQSLSGAINSLGGNFIDTINGYNSCTFIMEGTFSATLQVKGSTDGVNYVNLPLYNITTQGPVTTAGITAVGYYGIVEISAFKTIQFITSAYTSGTVNIFGNFSQALSFPIIPNFPAIVDTNFGTVGASTIRTASEIGNSTGAASFNSGTTTAQVLRVVLPTDQTGINTFVDKNGSGSISALNGTVIATTTGCSTVNFTVTGTWNAILAIEGSADSGVTWTLMNGDIDATDTIAPYVYNNTLVTVPCGGLQQVRLRGFTYTSGTANISWNSGAGLSLVEIFSSDRNGTGTVSTLNGTVVFNTQNSSTVQVNVTGTWNAIFTIEGFLNNNWIVISGDIDTTDIVSTTFSANGLVTINCGGFAQVRVRATTYTSGTATIDWNSSTGTAILEVFNGNGNVLKTSDNSTGTIGSAIPIFAITTGGKDTSGNLQSFITVPSGEQFVRDVLNVSSQFRAQSVTTTAAEALGGATILANRKLLHITPTNGTIYWGYSNTVTTTTGTPIFPNNTLWLSVTNNVHVWIIAGATTDSRIGELS